MEWPGIADVREGHDGIGICKLLRFCKKPLEDVMLLVPMWITKVEVILGASGVQGWGAIRCSAVV